MTTANLDIQQLSHLESSFACEASDVTHLAGDGSSRQYFRITKAFGKHDSLIVMKLSGEDKDQLQAGSYPFLMTQKVMMDQGFAVPTIVQTAPELGLMILEDFGDLTLWGHLHQLDQKGASDGEQPSKTAVYQGCFSLLTEFLSLKGTKEDRWQQWSFDQAKLSFEFDFFLHHYIDKAHNRLPADLSTIHKERDLLCRMLAEDSHYFCHRDFHSKNIMVRSGGSKAAPNLGIIDFQDARLGPASYDAVSLFFDPYVNLSHAERHQLYDSFCAYVYSQFQDQRQSQSQNSQVPTQAVNGLRSLKSPMILQRLTKALGSFGYLTLDQDRGDYLQHQGPALAILLEIDELHRDFPATMALLGHC